MSPEADETWRHGDCRLKPPVGGGYWPTPPKDGWCGEHQPREGESEKPKAREPGWYWVRYEEPDEDWEPMYWNGSAFDYGGLLLTEDRFDEIGPRLEPPA
jgi:hypothetical protein